MSLPIFESSIKSLPLLTRGKVRDIYEVDEKHLLIVTTDRLSAFDVILPTPIPDKGKVLTGLSNFWFNKLSDIIPNHLTDISPESVVKPEEREQVEGRAIVVGRYKPLAVEAVARGYIEGSGWKEYQASHSICGIPLPAGLQRASRLPQPIFTPSTKAELGAHDENIHFADVEQLLGKNLARQVRNTTLELYKAATDYALSRGIIIADTKFEFGLDDDGKLFWIDEALTPDSSRFWPLDTYREGESPASFDKQFIRNWLESTGWNKQPPAPLVPAEIAEKTATKYREALIRLTES
ncbi:MAG: phosphoribosylaminoimidazolesuccinocarboxamide synthase [Pseudomonadota bacterium]